MYLLLRSVPDTLYATSSSIGAYQAGLAVSEHLGRRITLSRRIAVKPTFDQLGPRTMHWLHADSGSTSYLPSYDSPVS